MSVLFWGSDGDFPISYSTGHIMEHLKSSFRKVYSRYGDLMNKYEVSLSRMLYDILKLDQSQFPNQWLETLHLFYDHATEPNLYRITRFTWGISYGCDMPSANAHPSEHLVQSLFETCICSNCWDVVIFSTFLLRISRGTYSFFL